MLQQGDMVISKIFIELNKNFGFTELKVSDNNLDTIEDTRDHNGTYEICINGKWYTEVGFYEKFINISDISRYQS